MGNRHRHRSKPSLGHCDHCRENQQIQLNAKGRQPDSGIGGSYNSRVTKNLQGAGADNTVDQGKEFAHHQKVAKALECDYYLFAHHTPPGSLDWTRIPMTGLGSSRPKGVALKRSPRE